MSAGRPTPILTATRSLRADDAPAARALVVAAFGGTPYAPRLLEVVDQALGGVDDEARGTVLDDATGIAGVAVHGAIAGSEGAAKLHVLAARAGPAAAEAMAALLAAIISAARSSGARFVAAELPDDPVVAPLAAALHAQGFVEEARVADFFRDGVALRLLRLTTGAGRA